MNQIQCFQNKLLEEFDKQGLLHQSDLKELEKTKLGISGQMFIELLVEKQENLLEEQIISKRIQEIKEVFEKHQIKLQIVFDGIKKRQNSYQDQTYQINQFWKSFLQLKKNYDHLTVFQSFVKSQLINDLLVKQGIEVLIAPYQSYSQLKWMLNNNHINSICANIDYCGYLMNQKQQTNFIVKVDLQKEQIYWIDAREIQLKMEVNLLDWLILGGVNQEKPLIPIKDNNIYQSVTQFKKDDLSPEENKIFNQVKKMIDANPIFNNNSEIESQQKLFSEVMTELFGVYLPFQIYAFMCFNSLSIRLTKLVACNVLEIEIPIADSRELKNSIDIFYSEYYSDICGYLIENLNDMFKKKTYCIQKYYMENKDYFQVTNHNTQETLQQFQKFQDSEKNISIFKTIELYQQHIKVEKKKTQNLEIDKNYNQLEININLLFLQLFRYINLNNGSITKIACAIRHSDSKFEEQIFIILQILMTSSISHIFGNQFTEGLKVRKSSIDNDILNCQNNDFEISNLFSVINVLVPDREKLMIVCISRVMGLIIPQNNYLSESQRQNMIDFDSYQYISLVTQVQQVLQDGYESIKFNQYGKQKEFKQFGENKFRSNFNADFCATIKLLLQGKIKIQDIDKG